MTNPIKQPTIGDMLVYNGISFIPVSPANLPIFVDNKYIQTTFDYTCAVSGFKYIGDIPAGSRVQSVELIINQQFDGNTQLSVGDELVNDRLMTIADNIPSVTDIYLANISSLYVTKTQIFIYITNNVLQFGAGEVIVYYF